MFHDRKPETLTLRDGRNVTVRAMTVDDGQTVVAFYRSLPEEDRLYLREDVTAPDFPARYMAKASDESAFTLLAVADGEIVGDATLYRDRHGWTRHVASIRAAVARPWQRSGLATSMMRRLVQHAVSIGVDKLVAEVVDNQVGARRAFERLGFVVEASLRGHVRDVHGKRRDLLIMSNDVSHIWERMEAMVADYSPTQEG